MKTGKLSYVSRIEPVKHKTGVPQKMWSELAIQLLGHIGHLNFLKEQLVEAVKLNPKPLLHFQTKVLEDGTEAVLFDGCDEPFTLQEACTLWFTYLKEDELQKIFPDYKKHKAYIQFIQSR